jgi:hypothetical protein
MAVYRVFTPEGGAVEWPDGVKLEEEYPAFSIVLGSEEAIAPLRKKYPIEKLDRPAERGRRAGRVMRPGRTKHRDPNVPDRRRLRAGQGGADSRQDPGRPDPANNVEGVVVDAPDAGVWTVNVVAAEVQQGP